MRIKFYLLKNIFEFKLKVNGDKFSASPVVVDLKCDEKCLILFWREYNFKVNFDFKCVHVINFYYLKKKEFQY